jgi:hypothetical protein
VATHGRPMRAFWGEFENPFLLGLLVDLLRVLA